MNLNRRSLLLGAAALGGMTLGGCAGQTTGQATSTGPAMTVGLTYIPNIQFSPFYVVRGTVQRCRAHALTPASWHPGGAVHRTHSRR